MDLRKEDLPATLQAFELLDNKEIFLAEQVVNNQSEIELFTARYAGKLIKAKTMVAAENRSSYGNAPTQRRRSSANIIIIFIILIFLALVIYGFYTGWLQEKLHLKV
ncbi:MAG: hypothetical protein ABJA37_10190 [Ferruginibacter sp.]